MSSMQTYFSDLHVVHYLHPRRRFSSGMKISGAENNVRPRSHELYTLTNFLRTPKIHLNYRQNL